VGADPNTTVLGIAIYGGGGNDTIYGTQAADHLAGGSGDDTIYAGGGLDLVYGDSGFNVDPITRTLVMVTHDLGYGSLAFGPVRDQLVAGKDKLYGGTGNDVIFGDHGVVQQIVPRGTIHEDYAAAAGRSAFFNAFSATASDKLLTTGFIEEIYSAEPGNGANDTIEGNAGLDRILGGNGSDTISGGADADVIFGDQGRLSYIAADYFGHPDSDLTTLDLVESIDTGAAYGAADTITDDASDDIIFGGQGGDIIDAGAGQNIVFGDHGRILGVDAGVNAPVGSAKSDDDYQVQVLGLVTSIATGSTNGAANEEGNGNDTITTGIGRDMIFGGGGDDIINAFASSGGTAVGDGNNIVFGDHGLVDYLAEEILQAEPLVNPARTDDIDRIWSIATAMGGKDTIDTGDRNDIVLGGQDEDVIRTGQGSNIALGDSGKLTSAEFDVAPSLMVFSVHEFIVCEIETIGFEDGGRDFITGSDLNDVIFGGAGGDVIYAGDGDDLVFGDQGRIECKNGVPFIPEISLRPVCWDLENQDGSAHANQGFLLFEALNVDKSTGAGDDLVFGQGGDDLIMGQQGDDVLYGGDGDDVLIGGSNVAGVTDDQGVFHYALDGDDRIDGGAGVDAIAGDNAEICYRPDDIDVRFRTLSGTQIYYVPGVPNSPSAASISDRQFDAIDSFATATWRADPRHHTQFHIMLLDHSDDIELNHPESYGNDYIAGGAGEDEIFGQLGDDVIQGDGTIGLGASLPARLSYADNLAAAQLSVTRSDGSKLAVTDFTAYDAWRNTVASGIGDLNVAASFEGLGDADDYIEGNGGRDVIFGNLGQDDILGGSSDLFGFTTAEMRPDGADLIFGGAGTDISRNNYGDATVDANGVVTVKPDGHALDADTIVGDNGRILRLVGVNGTVRGTGDYAPTAANGFVASTGGLLNYAYDTEAIGSGAGYHHIVVRAVEQLDYTPGGILYDAAAASDRGGSDEIHGESGDDFIYGQLGHDIIFGEGQDDDIIGGTGNDWISGGTGNDGVIGDDGRIMTSR
ncbi:MAG: hypothetical protein KDH16_11645, partial [Rhodocyclaceae bacterium]|nr:hypothetical protein [Rhodocyclaceae bacterium]